MNFRKKKSIIWHLSREEFIDLYNKSNNLGEILKFFGMVNKGGNSNTVKRRIIHEGLDLNKFKLGLNSNKGRTFPKESLALELILVENSSYGRHLLKKRLLNNNILNNECVECGQGPEWNGKPLVLVLDHINGIHNDNRLENLRMLCPNCNSQTDTFAGRNKKYK